MIADKQIKIAEKNKKKSIKSLILIRISGLSAIFSQSAIICVICG
jgi:hypothetical protein